MEEIISVAHIESCKHLLHYMPNFGFRVWFGSLLHVVEQLKKSIVRHTSSIYLHCKYWSTLYRAVFHKLEYKVQLLLLSHELFQLHNVWVLLQLSK